MALSRRDKSLNKDIEQFPQVFPITEDMDTTFDGISRMVMLDRYAFKDTSHKTLKEGDLVVLTVKQDPKYPSRGVGEVLRIHDTNHVDVLVGEDYRGSLTDPDEVETGVVSRKVDELDKPLEIYYEQIAKRVAYALSRQESKKNQDKYFKEFYKVIASKDFVPAGRVLYGTGTGAKVTLFNCFVLPNPKDSRDGIGDHSKLIMEIMSHGGGVGTNGSTLRPRNTLARSVNGKSSGSVTWMDYFSYLTNVVQQGGSRRGAQMIMLNVWHPDILEFIISKIQNPTILRFIIENIDDAQIKSLAKDKLKFKPLTEPEREMCENVVKHKDDYSKRTYDQAKQKLDDGGTYSVNNPDFLTGANISVGLTDDFMQAVKDDKDWALKFPDTEHYSKEEMDDYNENWADCGDVREWEKQGHGVKTYRTIPAKELWKLICICATYSGEPGIFFIDRANKMSNSVAYGQPVVATNPCKPHCMAV